MNNNNSFNNSCNNDFSNNNKYNVNLYNSVFNNKYLRNIIFYHLNKFNILMVNIEFTQLEQWKEFKYKEYLNRVTFDFDEDSEFQEINLNELPENIKHIIIPPPKELISLPDHIESVSYTIQVEIDYFKHLQQPHSSKINTLTVEWREDFSEEEISTNVLPESITDLEFYFGISPKVKLSKNLFPENLKKLSIDSMKLFKVERFPLESLTHIKISNSDPLIMNWLSTLNTKNLVRLEFTQTYDHYCIDSYIQFPDTPTELVISGNTFNANLPVNLKLLDLFIKNYKNPIQFPSSLENLSITYQNNKLEQEIFQNLQQVPPNLKSLSLSCSSITDNKGNTILPKKLEKLFIHSSFNQVLQVNQLPSTLTSLNFLGSSFNQVIDVNVLPASLERLLLNFNYSQVINPLAIPSNLKLLQIFNTSYHHPINLTPLTHPNTVIDCHDISLYYQATSPDYNDIRVLRLPNRFNSPLSTLQLQDKSNLEYLHLGNSGFNYPIELSDLPIQNNIKTLELSCEFNQFLNLEYFQNLETLIIDPYFSNPIIITTTTTIIDDQQQQHLHYNYYKLKNIIVYPKRDSFIKDLDINFYQFLKCNNTE